MAVLTISDDKLQLRTSGIESIFARNIRGGRFKQTYWEYAFSPDKIFEIKKVFSNILIDERVKERVKQEHARRLKLFHIKKLKDCDIEIPLKTKPYPFQKVGIKYMLEALGE